MTRTFGYNMPELVSWVHFMVWPVALLLLMGSSTRSEQRPAVLGSLG